MTEREKDLVEAEISRRRQLARVAPDKIAAEHMEVAQALEACYVQSIVWEVMACREFPRLGKKSALCPMRAPVRRLSARAGGRCSGR